MVRLNLVRLTKRVPLIQFRKGGLAAASTKAPSQQASSEKTGGNKVNFKGPFTTVEFAKLYKKNALIGK